MSDLGNQSELLTVRQSARARETGWFRRGLTARSEASEQDSTSTATTDDPESFEQ